MSLTVSSHFQSKIDQLNPSSMAFEFTLVTGVGSFERLGMAKQGFGYQCSVIDTMSGFAYFGNFTFTNSAAFINKIQLSDFTFVGSITIVTSGSAGTRSAVIDQLNNKAYFGADGIAPDAQRVWEVDLSTFTLTGSYFEFSGGLNAIHTGQLDTNITSGHLYFSTAAFINKIQTTDLTGVNSLNLTSIVSSNSVNYSSAIDVNSGYLYVGRGRVVAWDGFVSKVKLSDFTEEDVIQPLSCNIIYSMVIDTTNNKLFVGADNGQIAKIDLDTFVVENSIPSGVQDLRSAAIYVPGDYAYFGSNDNDRMVKVRLSNLEIIDTINLSEDMRTIVIDDTTEKAYIGSYNTFSATGSRAIYKYPVSVVTDYTDKVIKNGYGDVGRDVSDVVGGDWEVTVENADGTFNDIIANKSNYFFKEGLFKFGFSTDSGTNDFMQLFGGVLTGVKYSGVETTLTFEDKLARLKKRLVGTDETPVSFVNTNVNVADLAWWVSTSYGGLSSVRSTSNVDINYQSWLEWWTIFNDNTVLVNAEFKGEDVAEIFDVIQRLSDSVIYAEGDNKLYFNRWTGAGSDSLTVSGSYTTGEDKLDLAGDTIVNKVDVLLGYNPTSDAWAGAVSKQNSLSVNQYGINDRIYDSKLVWYADSTSAINLAERVIFRKTEPNGNPEVTVPLIALASQLGDEIAFSSRVTSISQPYNLQGYNVDIEDKTITLSMDEGFSVGGARLHGFILDDAYWGLLDKTYNHLT